MFLKVRIFRNFLDITFDVIEIPTSMLKVFIECKGVKFVVSDSWVQP